MCKVSIILTTYNCVDHLSSTMKSIAMQDYPSIQVVIKDGESTDGTLALIQSYAGETNKDSSNSFPFEVVYKSCSDNGIYDAMNQGYQLADGDIIVFFNDLFRRKDAVSMMVQAMIDNNADGAHADLIYQDADGRPIRYWHMGQGDITKGWMPGHPTLFLRRKVYEKFGLYRTDYKISADYEFMIRILKNHQLKLAYVPVIIVAMYYGGTSTGNFDGYFRSLQEGHDALVINGVRHAWSTDFRRTCRLVMQFIRAKRLSKDNNLWKKL